MLEPAQSPDHGTSSADFAVCASEHANGLHGLAEIAAQLGSERLVEESTELAERVAEGRFYVAFVGQFKRGKSTLINALVEQQVLPTGVIPVTTVATVIRYGERPTVRVRTHGASVEIGICDLEQYVSEEHNPENKKGVDGVEVFLPNVLLQSGMCLVDTPGLGSVFEGNTAATEAFIPHIDAAIIVVGSDPPLSGDELDLVETVAQHVRDLILILNKADRVTDAERAAAKSFASMMIERRLGRPVSPILEISATERLEGGVAARDWSRLLTALKELVETSGRLLIRRAGQRGIQRISEQLLSVVREERDALTRPLEESERRIADMRRTLGDAERSMRDLGYLFTAEQQRLHDMFVERRKEFAQRTMPVALDELQKWMVSANRSSGPSFRRELMHEAQEITKRHVLPWLQREQEDAEQIYGEATRRFVDFANDFLRQLADADVPELLRIPHALDPERGLRARSQFRFYDFITVARPASPLRFAADALLGLFRLYRSIERDGQEFLERLIEVNSSRVQSDVDDRVLESRRGLEADIRVLLRDVKTAAERALEHARAAKASGGTAVDGMLTHLSALEEKIRTLKGSESPVGERPPIATPDNTS